MNRFIIFRGACSPCHNEIDQTHDCTEQKECSADDTNPVKRSKPGDCFKEIGVNQQPVTIKRSPHKSLRQTGSIDWNDVEQNPDGSKPEMGAHKLPTPQRCLEQPWEEPVRHSERHHTVPSQRTSMYMGDRPVGVVTE